MIDTYEGIIQHLEGLRVFLDRPPSLEPMMRALNRLGSNGELAPEKVIVVAGTNGKGSVSATLERLILGTGQSVGLYTSPHLIQTTERIRLNAEDISIPEFVDLYRDLAEIISAENLSHFEALTLMAVLSFHRAKLDWFIFEVGLGGTWDATNAIPHQNCIITSLALDHENLLGSNLTSIAENKFGVVGNKNLVVHAPLTDEVETIRKRVAEKTTSHWVLQKPFRFQTRRSSTAGPVTTIEYENQSQELRLLGRRGAQNTALALTAFENLFPYFPLAEALKNLQDVRWPGRMEKFLLAASPCPVYLSGDHNVQGAESLFEILKDFEYSRVHLLIGIGVDKNAKEMLACFSEIPRAEIHLTETPFKGLGIRDYGDWFERAASAHAKPAEAFAHVLATAEPADLIVVTGSLYLVGLIRSLCLRANRTDHFSTQRLC